MKIMDEMTQQINLGEGICKELKRFYFEEIKWVDRYNQVAYKFNELKIKARIFYSGMNDLEILKELNRYGPQDLSDMINN